MNTSSETRAFTFLLNRLAKPHPGAGHGGSVRSSGSGAALDPDTHPLSPDTQTCPRLCFVPRGGCRLPDFGLCRREVMPEIRSRRRGDSCAVWECFAAP